MSDIRFSYAILSETLINSKEIGLFNFIESSLIFNETEIPCTLNKKIERFIIGHNERYKKKCKQNRELFVKKYETWLQREFSCNCSIDENAAKKTSKPYSQCSERMKRKRCLSLSNLSEPEEIEVVLLGNLRKSGRKVDAQIIKELEATSPKRKKRICQILTKQETEPIPCTNDEALAPKTDLRLNKGQYDRLRIQTKSRKSVIP